MKNESNNKQRKKSRAISPRIIAFPIGNKLRKKHKAPTDVRHKKNSHIGNNICRPRCEVGSSKDQSNIAIAIAVKEHQESFEIKEVGVGFIGPNGKLIKYLQFYSKSFTDNSGAFFN